MATQAGRAERLRRRRSRLSAAREFAAVNLADFILSMGSDRRDELPDAVVVILRCAEKARDGLDEELRAVGVEPSKEHYLEFQEHLVRALADWLRGTWLNVPDFAIAAQLGRLRHVLLGDLSDLRKWVAAVIDAVIRAETTSQLADLRAVLRALLRVEVLRLLLRASLPVGLSRLPYKRAPIEALDQLTLVGDPSPPSSPALDSWRCA